MIGIDVGVSGGAVLLRDTDGEVLDTLVFATSTEHDIAEVFEEWLGYAPESCRRAACIEEVASRPGQGRSSIFKFGKHYGFLRGVLTALKVPFESVSPHKWQKDLRCLTKGDKNITKAAAQRRWPQRKWTHALADAALIGEWARTRGLRQGREGI